MAKKHIIKTAALLAACFLALSACKFIPFENPEEQKQRQMEAELARQEKPALDAGQMLLESRTLSRQLENQAGLTLASYSALMPLFLVEEEYGVIFQRINDYYDTEFAALEDECDSFFETVKKTYGEEWIMLETIESPFEISYTYSLLDSPPKFICVQKTYVYSDNRGGGYTSWFPDVFLAETGWRLSFAELFGHNADKAEALLMEEIARWCEANTVPCENLPGLKASDFTGYYAIDANYLIFYAAPYMLSTNNDKPYEIKLVIDDFEGLFIK